MIFKSQIKDGKLVEKLPYIFNLEGMVEIEIRRPKRTPKQNNSIHLWFRLVEDECRERGITMEMLLKEGIEHPVAAEVLKEYIWKPVQKKLFGEISTTKLKTNQVDKIYDVINKAFGERVQLHVPFPSKEYDL